MSIKHKILGLGLAAALVLGGSVAALAATAVVETPLNVRAGAGTQFHVVDVARRGEVVNVDYCRGSWCLINRRGPDGWVSARYLSRDGGYYRDDYYDEPIYIERPRRRYVRPPFYPVYPRYRSPDFSACFGSKNARFCIYD
jgi:uncharacterized protein YraI